VFLQDLLRELRIEPSDEPLAARARAHRVGHPTRTCPADEPADLPLLTIRAAVYEDDDCLLRARQLKEAIGVGSAWGAECLDHVPIAEKEIVVDHRKLHPLVLKPEDIEGLRLADMLTGVCMIEISSMHGVHPCES
jgi:hypothetical protein